MQGSAGPAGPSIGWADATGTVVPGAYGQVAGDPTLANYLDPATGYQWRLSVEFGNVNAEGAGTVWTTDDCSGTEYYLTVLALPSLLPFPPRVVFEVATTSGTEFRVRNDDVALGGVPTDYVSVGLPGDCAISATTGFGFTAAQTTVVTQPTLTVTLPLHPVLIGQP